MEGITNYNSEKRSSFGLIARIYHSDLSSIMRNDCACRIIAKLADVDAVSILLYDGEKDRLINSGTYINADSLYYVDNKLTEEEQNRQKHVLKYITVYDFLLDRFHDLGIPSYISNNQLFNLLNEFKNPAFKHFNYRFFDEDLSEDDFTIEFLRICIENSKNLAATDTDESGYYILDRTKFYSNYKKIFKEKEQYPIGPTVQNLSGRLYYQTTAEAERKIEVYDSSRPFIHHEDLMKGATGGLPKAFNTFLIDNCGYSLKKHSDSKFNYYYSGIPLWSGNRCLGVIRILTSKEKGPLKHDDENGIGSRVRHATEMLGYFLDQSYAEQFVDDISHDWSEVEVAINKDIHEDGKQTSLARIPSNRHNRYCSKLRKAMNSFGCILRMSNFQGTPPKIVGKSKDPIEFRHFVENHVEKYDAIIDQGHFNTNLARYFPSTNQTAEQNHMKNDFRLVGISVELNYEDSALHKATYYYCSKRNRKGKKRDSEYVRETTGTYIFKNNLAPNVSEYFHQELLNLLQNFKIMDDDKKKQLVTLKHVLLMDIPALDVDGLITFQNTTNRPFNLMDVRFAYGEMKRFGLEKSKANRVRDKAYGESAGYFVHGISNAITLCLTQLKKLQNEIHEDVSIKITNLSIIMEWINNTVINLKRLSTLNRNMEELEKKQTTYWNLCDHVSDLCESLSSIGNICKATQVYFSNNIPKNKRNTFLNKDAVLLCVFNMLENALKYSFNESNKGQVDGYNPEDKTTQGHVHVSTTIENEYYIIKVINWGCFISNNKMDLNSSDHELIAKRFLSKNPVNTQLFKRSTPIWDTISGKGLPTMTKFAILLDGTWTHEHNLKDSSTTFTLKLKII